MIAQRAPSVTAVDGAPEMLEVAAASQPGANVRFEQVDLFSWRPERRYDAAFFGFFLSHVPEERFENFWELVGDALVPGGSVVFVDDAYRAPEEPRPVLLGPGSALSVEVVAGAVGAAQQDRVGLITRPHADLVAVGIHRHRGLARARPHHHPSGLVRPVDQLVGAVGTDGEAHQVAGLQRTLAVRGA
jgi:SAM-dependent methyltransferase